MQTSVSNAIVIMIAMCAGCCAVYPQANVGSELRSRIQAGELAVSSSTGQRDGGAWLALAVAYEDGARYGEAERAFRKATSLLKPGDRAQYAEALDAMGVMYVERGKFGKAQGLERKALAIRQERNDALGIGRSYSHLAMLAYGRRDMRGAEADAEMAVSLLAPERPGQAGTAGATREEKMSALIDIALIRCADGACEKAGHDLERALRLATAEYPANSVPVGLLHFLLGYTHGKSGDVQGGLALMKSGIEEMNPQMGWGHPTYVAALNAYRAALVRAGKTDDAAEVEESIAKLGVLAPQAGSGSAFGGLSNALR